MTCSVASRKRRNPRWIAPAFILGIFGGRAESDLPHHPPEEKGSLPVLSFLSANKVLFLGSEGRFGSDLERYEFRAGQKRRLTFCSGLSKFGGRKGSPLNFEFQYRGRSFPKEEISRELFCGSEVLYVYFKFQLNSFAMYELWLIVRKRALDMCLKYSILLHRFTNKGFQFYTETPRWQCL